MSEINMSQIDHMQFDVLKEIGNIGSGNASTALAQMLGLRVDMKVPKVELLEFNQLADFVGGPELIVVGILLTLQGDIDGMMMFMLDRPSALSLVHLLLGEMGGNQTDKFSEMDMSALQEIGNIVTGAYLSSLSSLTSLTISPSIPYISVDMAGAILSVPAIEFGKLGDKALLIETEFLNEATHVNGYFILIPSLPSYGKILNTLGL